GYDCTNGAVSEAVASHGGSNRQRKNRPEQTPRICGSGPSRDSGRAADPGFQSRHGGAESRGLVSGGAAVTPSASTAPAYGVQDWVRILHNAASTPQDHPRYGEARQVAQLALQNIDELQGQASETERKALAPGQVGTALVSFGHGASLGLAGDPDYLAQARAANPWTAGIADVAGTAALGGLAAPVVAGLSPVAGAAGLGGGLAARRGGSEAIPGVSRRKR